MRMCISLRVTIEQWITMRYVDFNVYLFDGPHTLQDQRDGLVTPLPPLDEDLCLSLAIGTILRHAKAQWAVSHQLN